MHKLDMNSETTPTEPQAKTPVTAETAPATTTTKTAVDPKPSMSDNQNPKPLVRPLDTKKSMAKSSNVGLIIGALIAIAAGVGTGYGSFKLYAQSNNVLTEPIEKVATEGSIKEGDVFGSNNTDNFKDDATGYLEAGGLDGEGTHRLLRPGGPAQTVYLTSSVTDLSKLEGMEVKVWGETFKGQKAGWLMDVGRVEVVKVQGEAPTE